MDRKDLAAQQARLAEHRQVQNHTKQTDRSTSAAKDADPQDQAFTEQGSIKPDFEKAHDDAIAHGEKNDPQVSPQLREQDAARLTPEMKPTPPASTRDQVDRDALLERLQKTNEQAKTRQEPPDHGNMKDGQDHD